MTRWLPDPDDPSTLLSRRYRPAWLWALVPWIMLVLTVTLFLGLAVL